MQKYILAVALCFNLSAMATAIADPLGLFVNQCLSFNADIGSFRYAQDLPDKTQALEQTLLGLHNINDRLNYYRTLVKDPIHGENLLLCQVHLADELAKLLSSPHIIQWTHYLGLLSAPYPQLALLLQRLQHDVLPIAIKAQLHSAQASVNFSLRQREFRLQFNDLNCQLAPSPAESVSISRYLLNHNDEPCRRAAWQNYQQRLRQRNHQALQLIKQIRTNFAISQGVQNYALWQLEQQQLNHEELTAYLASQTHVTQVLPWNLVQALSKQSHKFTALDGEQTLAQLFEALSSLGITVETLSHYELATNAAIENATPDNAEQPKVDKTYVYRIWHHDRLLGEIFTSFGATNIAYTLRQALPGQQFGQIALSVQSTLSRRADVASLVQAMSEAITSLATGAQFYLVATLGHQPASAIGTLWLNQYLTQAIALPPESPREQLLNDYKQQLKVFNSKLILAFYLEEQQDFSTKTKKSLSQAFALSFGEPWQDADQLIYALGAIANEGVSYYLPLWHRSLARLIFQQSNSLSNEDVFNILIVNETYAPLTDQLAQLIQGPVDPLSLIRRFTHASITQE
ncbi:hypothetical protein [Shewanella sp. SR44-3]|uniref:hypothetical protein n=1 Tax=Shewanella sp. SR44-3 TaxID=2760936 RepID=UPI0015FCE95C|nr:hypothetical protein [Shewanella sp. SR44-3]MBB1267820.1 hypothetical protein [Shewanella sp. SR44-3]